MNTTERLLCVILFCLLASIAILCGDFWVLRNQVNELQTMYTLQQQEIQQLQQIQDTYVTIEEHERDMLVYKDVIKAVVKGTAEEW